MQHMKLLSNISTFFHFGFSLGLTAWQTLGFLVWVIPPTKTTQVRKMWKHKFTSMCQPLRLIRIRLLKEKGKYLYSDL